eukprot:scaffold7375_cov268-Pinguiococcus_pyrenoidosus.AAC.43
MPRRTEKAKNKNRKSCLPEHGKDDQQATLLPRQVRRCAVPCDQLEIASPPSLSAALGFCGRSDANVFLRCAPGSLPRFCRCVARSSHRRGAQAQDKPGYKKCPSVFRAAETSHEGLIRLPKGPLPFFADAFDPVNLNRSRF